MKGDARRLGAVLSGLAGLRVACVHGDDPVLVRAAARRIVEAAAGSAGDPFRVTELEGDRPEPIETAAASGSLLGGRPVVWVRRAGERLLPLIERLLAEPGAALAVFEFTALTARSRVRGAVEASRSGCAIVCSVRPGDRRLAIRGALDDAQVTADEDAIAALAAHADAAEWDGAAAGLVAALFAGAGGRLDLAAVRELCGSGAAEGLDTAVMAALAGDGAALDAAMSAVLAEGTGAIGMLRIGLGHLQRLRAVAARLGKGMSVAGAGRGLRPPVFFRDERAAAAALRRWDTAALSEAAARAWRAERGSKASGAPQDAICRDALSALGRGPRL